MNASVKPTPNEGYASNGSHLAPGDVYWQALAQRDPAALANWTLCEPGPGRSLEFTFLATPVRVDFDARRLYHPSPDGWVVRDDPLLELAALMYFSRVKSLHPLCRDIVGLADLSESHFFVGPHTLQLDALPARYGSDLEGFCQAALALGGQLEDMADAAACLWPFPRIPLYFLLWQRDDEFPARIRVLFDRSIDACLPADAIWALVNRVAQLFAEH